MKEVITYKEKVKKIVEENINEKNDNPFDSSFRFIDKYHPEEMHISLRFPGIFVKSLGTEVFTKDNRTLKMDSAHLVLNDEILPNDAVINLEHQSYILSESKIDALYEYKLQLTIKHKILALPVVATNIGEKDTSKIYESHGDAFKVYIRVFTDKEIQKRLNTLTYIVNNNKKLTKINSLDFAFVLLFAQKQVAKKYTEKVVKLFRDVKDIDEEIQYDLYYVLKKLIRAHFKDDEDKTKELLTMITEAIHPDILERIPTLKKALNEVDELTAELQIVKKESEEKDEEIRILKEKLKEKNG